MVIANYRTNRLNLAVHISDTGLSRRDCTNRVYVNILFSKKDIPAPLLHEKWRWLRLGKGLNCFAWPGRTLLGEIPATIVRLSEVLISVNGIYKKTEGCSLIIFASYSDVKVSVVSP